MCAALHKNKTNLKTDIFAQKPSTIAGIRGAHATTVFFFPVKISYKFSQRRLVLETVTFGGGDMAQTETAAKRSERASENFMQTFTQFSLNGLAFYMLSLFKYFHSFHKVSEVKHTDRVDSNFSIDVIPPNK